MKIAPTWVFATGKEAGMESLPNYDNWKTEADDRDDFDPYLEAEDEE
jgi:hypothetical protein